MWPNQRKKKTNKALGVIICLVAFVLSLLGAFVGTLYFTLPDTEELLVTEEVFYSYEDVDAVSHTKLSGAEGELSVHFLELGNKYTGDCTYIRYGTTDILIDCGSKSSSISYVSNYLKNYMKDDVIEYCIVTHAHADHYAGFATSGKVKSLFELFKYETIIDFGSATRKSATSGAMKNYVTKRALAKDAEGNKADHVDVSTEVKKGENLVYEIGANGEVKLEILYNYYYDHNESSSENNYSVCSLLTYDEKTFLFTGDLEEHKSNGETKLLEDNASLQAIKNNGKEYGVDLYKAGHHGSKTSSSQAFIDAIRPKVVCVCCCAGSSEYTNNIDNQFPTQEFINIVGKYTKNIYVTTLCVDYDNNEFTSMNGNIVVIALKDQAELGVDCSNNNTILKETEWFSRVIIDKGVERPMRMVIGYEDASLHP